MNELVAISTFVLLCLAVGTATRWGLKQLYVMSAFIILASNVTVGVQVDVFGVSISLGVIIYSIIYLVTDIVSEFHERHEAYKLAATNVVIQIAFYIYIFISILATPSGGQEAYNAMVSLFASTARITIAALVASLGAFIDIYFYEWMLKKAAIENERYAPKLWLRNIISTFIGQSVNTALFFTIALYGVVPNLTSIILSAIAIKWAIAVIDTPFLYWARLIHQRANL